MQRPKSKPGTKLRSTRRPQRLTVKPASHELLFGTCTRCGGKEGVSLTLRCPYGQLRDQDLEAIEAGYIDFDGYKWFRKHTMD